jgi:two-component system, NarL family, response regulator DegU
MRRLKLLIADDHQLMLEAIKLALNEADDDFEIVGTTSRGTQVLPLVAQTQPDLVVLDLRMPKMDGLACLEQIRRRHPNVKVVILSGLEDPEVVRTAFARGATAFIRKHIDPRDLPSALRQAIEGTVFQTFGEAPAAEGGAGRDAGLSEREVSILQALGNGLSNKQIAKQLWLAEQTVKFHLTNIYRKLDVSTRTEAVRHAYAHGMLDSPLLEHADTAA